MEIDLYHVPSNSSVSETLPRSKVTFYKIHPFCDSTQCCFETTKLVNGSNRHCPRAAAASYARKNGISPRVIRRLKTLIDFLLTPILRSH